MVFQDNFNSTTNKGDKIICIIPARGQSKRLPGKNIIDFFGKPLIAHSIITAKKSKYIQEIFVTTDDEEIANISISYGAKVIKRPRNISTDFSTTFSAIKHALDQEEIKELNPLAILMLQPTSPLRPLNLLEEGIVSFLKSIDEVDSLISVSLNTNKIGKIENDGFIPLSYAVGQRSQDLEPTYFENGLLYILKVDVILNKGNLFGGNIKTLIINSPYSDVDIDTREDLDWAKFIGKKYGLNHE